MIVVLVATIVPAGNASAQVEDWIEDEFADITQHRVDVSATQVIELTADAVIESSAPDSPVDLLLGSSNGIARFGDTLFVADRVQDVVLVADLRTDYFIDSFGSPGEGPGEFGDASGVLVSDDRIFVLDWRRRGVHVFDRSYQALDLLHTGSMLADQFALAGGDLIVAPPNRVEHLFEVRGTVAPYPLEAGVGKVIPERFETAWANNQAFVAGNGRGDIVLAWFGLPVVVVYNDSLEATDLIVFDGIERSYDPADHPGGGVPAIFHALKIDDASNIYVTYGHNLLRLSGWREGRAVVNRFALSDAEGESYVPADGVDVTGDELYVSSGSTSAIYRYRLPGR